MQDLIDPGIAEGKGVQLTPEGIGREDQSDEKNCRDNPPESQHDALYRLAGNRNLRLTRRAATCAKSRPAVYMALAVIGYSASRHTVW